jgi:type IV secretion system protein VirB10
VSGPGEVPGPIPPKQDPREFVLRGKPRPVVRFRRGLIVGITGAVAATLVTLSWLALEPPSLRKAASSAVGDRPASSGRADALANAPTTYGDVPRLGAPLPGDLGRPILDHQRSVGAAPPEVALDSEAARAADEQRRRIASAKQAARISPLIVELAGGRDEAAAPSAALPAEAPAEEVPSAQIAVAAGDQHKTASTRSSGSSDLNPHALVAPASPWTLTAGTVIPASLITGLDSDLPGIVLAQVTENVRDSATGRTVLIPQGARLIGHYDSRVAYGQRRALLVWTRIVLPDGSSIRLDNMPATDRSGFAGLEDEVDSHSWSLLKGVALSTLLGVGTQLSIASSESDLVRALRESAQQSAANAGDRITVRNLDVRPTIRVRPGWPVHAIVATDLVLQPWRG